MLCYLRKNNQFSISMSVFRENEYASYHIQDDILHVVYKQRTSVNLPMAIQIVEDRLVIQEGLAYKVLCDIRGVCQIDKAARDYLAIEGSVLVVVTAFLVENTVTKALSEFYLQINNPPVPSKSFTDLEAAKRYLLEF